MFKDDGLPPTYETLAKITRTENASLSWLIEGIGSPYLYALVPDDAELVEEVEARLDDETWRVGAITDGEHITVVLHQYAQLVEKRGLIHYRAVDILSGRLGPLITAKLAALQERHRGAIVKKIGRDEMLQGLRDGWGSYQLFGDQGSKPLLDGVGMDKSPMSMRDSRVAEAAPPPYARAGRGPLRADLLRLTSVIPDLEPDECTALNVLIGAMADRVEARKKR